MVRPSRRREMAQRSVAEHGISIRMARAAFSISATCYRYQPRLSDENAEIAYWLIRLADTHCRWGVGLCFFVPAQRQGLSLESQARVSNLS